MSGKKIVIIDDDPEICDAMSEILGEYGYQVFTALDTTSGYQLLQDDKPDLLILDIMMENKAAGIIISRQLRKDPKFQKLPILMLTGMREQTGYFFPGEPKHDIFLPINDFLEKPHSPEILLEKVEKLLMN